VLYSLANPLVYDSPMINEYLDAMSNMRENTYVTAKHRLSLFPKFVKAVYEITPDELLLAIRAGKEDRYKVLNAYAAYIKKQKKSANRQRALVKGARQLLEYHDIEYSDRQFRLKVKLERAIKRAKSATDKQEIIEIMQATQDPFLKLAELWHAATGRRPEEIFSLRHCDLNFKKNPCTFIIRGEFTKMGDEQERPMTVELATHTQQLIAWKHRPRRIVENLKNGKSREIKVDPKLRSEDLLFTSYLRDETHFIPSINSIYDTHQDNLANLLDSLGKGERISAHPNAPRKFTFYRLRDHVKTTISDLGYGDFGEWYIGHSGSMYYNQPEAKRLELFRKIEPYLTYLDVSGLEAKGADMEVKLEQSNEQMLVMHKQMKILAEIAVTDDARVKKQKLAELAAIGFFETTGVE
jgi:hypothetical protein